MNEQLLAQLASVDDPIRTPAGHPELPRESQSQPGFLAKKRQFSEMRPTVSSAMIDGTQIWGSAFWELRTVLGQSVADKLLFEAWFKLKPEDVKAGNRASFVRKLLELAPAHEAQIRAAFTQRGLSL